MENSEDIFNQALTDVRNGSSTLEEAVSKWPEQEAELRELLTLTLALRGVPRQQIPQPRPRRKYLLKPAAALRLGWLKLFRLSGLSTAAILLMTAAVGGAYATSHSLPGERLFTLKKSAEQLQVKLEPDPVAKANLQMQLAQKRLSEAQQIFNSDQKNPEQEIAALTELSQQTQQAVSTVKDAAASQAIKESGHPIVQSLNDLTKQQTALLSQIKPYAEAKAAAKSASAANQEAKSFVAVVAAGDPETLASLPLGSTTVTASGNVSAIGNNSLTVDSTTFALATSTEVKNTDEQILDLSQITSTSTVTIVGVKSNRTLVAKEIVLVSPPDQAAENSPAGASASSTAASKNDPSSTPPSLKKVEPLKKIIDSSSTTPAASQEPSIGSFIYEDPRPQCPQSGC